ncbi:MAG TPA: AAA family ATPase [Candidatus Polarisedimenticolia bacterium]|nr:AAA family ATPase [Candidatus Polarisedimenticolia bacterium]
MKRQITKNSKPRHASLPPEKLRWRCSPERIPFETTAEIAPVSGDFGQERALRALRMGVEMTASGYNLFVCGLSGMSRGGMMVRLIEEMRSQSEAAPDRCYVNNFKNADRPRLLTLPRGQANVFKKEVESGIDFLRRRIPQVFEGEPFQRQKTRIVERYTQREKELMDDFTRRIARDQFALGRMQVGAVALPEIFPVLEGQMVPIEEIPKMVQEGKLENTAAEELERKYDQFRQEFTIVYRRTLLLSRELASEMSYLEQEAASVLVDGVIEELKEKYPSPAIAEYLEEVRHHILDNLDPFKERDGEEGQPPSEVAASPRLERMDRDPFRVYGVNVILAHAQNEKCPVIFETIPTYANLFGTVHRSYDARGAWNSDFMDLRGGSLLRADGGFLVMYALDALTETGVWRTLKRTLNHGKLEIQPVDMFFPFSAAALKPEPIDVHVKVVLIGDRDLYELLYQHEDDFKKIFKVRVEFDEEMSWSEEIIRQYAGRLRKLCDDEKLLPFDRSAVAKILEHGVRQAGRRGKITTRFFDLADLGRESCYIAHHAGSDIITAEHVRLALEAKNDRHNLTETKIREMVEQNLLFIDTTGERVGQVNGLSVLEIGGYAFGKPVRITASVALGKIGIINIERESNLSGRFHDKGVQIIGGYLRRTFAQNKPLSLSASVCFEQSYSGVDGDSASSTEIYSLLSALADAPIRQELAVTGSVNQQGDIQPIGGVNQKIEGFYDICKLKGLTGKQGVLIPAENVEDLMLRDEVIEAVARGLFHIYPVATIEQGIEILTGMRAGKRNSSNKFEPGTVFARADERLQNMAETLRKFD